MSPGHFGLAGIDFHRLICQRIEVALATADQTDRQTDKSQAAVMQQKQPQRKPGDKIVQLTLIINLNETIAIGNLN